MRTSPRPCGTPPGTGPRWRCPALVDLVLVHELCHLRAPGHGAAFRGLLRRTRPDADERERRFAEQEPQLWRGAVR
ncbi:M48 family metallopeptidase [Streptomyces incanus]|uniref:M48 family metallopeptidase n=1 Tax=Streptomyces incanus TaxID=887453 RepID=A0ABW0XK84_9ACTN